jgi:peptide/nickel transport system permease protein
MPVSYIRDQAIAAAGSSGNVDEIEKRLRENLGMNGTMLEGYWKWFSNFIRGDFGESLVKKQPVSDVIFKNMGVSFILSFVALVLELIIAIPLGVKCACNQYGKLDYAATVLTMIGISFPTFFLGSILIKFFVLDLGWFPATGLNSNLATDASWLERVGDTLWHLVLPMFLLVILNIGSWMRYTRTNTLEVLNADYIRTARAKGLSEHSVVYKHVFRNTLIPLVTVMAGTLPSLFGGAMITETIFGIQGIGKQAYDLLLKGDIPFIMGYNMFIAVLTVVGILLTDLMYAVVDPRVKLA